VISTSKKRFFTRLIVAQFNFSQLGYCETLRLTKGLTGGLMFSSSPVLERTGWLGLEYV